MATKRLSELRGRYSTVVIDESHNLRNRKRKDYQHIKRFIEDNDSKVMLLTATPYNLDFTDVANQLALFVAEEDPTRNSARDRHSRVRRRGGHPPPRLRR